MNRTRRALAVLVAAATAVAAVAVVAVGSTTATAAATPRNVAYSANVQTRGWMAAVSNGATAVTTGRALRLQAMQIRPIDKTPELTDTITATAPCAGPPG